VYLFRKEKQGMKHLKLSWSQIIAATFFGVILGITIAQRMNRPAIEFKKEEKNHTPPEPVKNSIESKKKGIRKRGLIIAGFAGIFMGVIVAAVNWYWYPQSPKWNYFLPILSVAIISLGVNLVAQSIIEGR
jgi:Na+/proline symporter